MKKFYIAAALLILIPAFSFCYLSFLSKSCESLNNSFETVTEYENTDMAELKDRFKKAENEWENYERIFAVSVNHAELDTVKQSLARAEAYLKSENMSEFMCELKVILDQIDHIKNLEQPTLQNIF